MSRFIIIVALAVVCGAGARAGADSFNGGREDVMLQGFHWESHKHFDGKSWYRIMQENAGVIRGAGFDAVWFPPPSKSVSPEGYLPTEWNVLDSAYGTQAELRAAVVALKPVHAIADIVINHRNGTQTEGSDFTNPSFGDNKAAVTWKDESGGHGHGDTGDDFRGGRDLDHTNPAVQEQVITWLRMLNTKVGFDGWRYDMAKGFFGGFVGRYDDETHPYLSVGEYWDDDPQHVIDWIDQTGARSMAFDFPTRDRLRSALLEHRFDELRAPDTRPKLAGAIGLWPDMIVTFIENHDTEPMRGNGLAFPDDQVIEGYAFVLTHPGIPCVFWRHFFDRGDADKQTITKLIALRKRNHIGRDSAVDIRASDSGRYAAIIDQRVGMKIGPGPWDPGDGWHVSLDGNDWAIWERNPG